MCSGEGGILSSSIDNACKYIFEYPPNCYSVSEENVKRVDAIEINFGQSAKTGMGGHLPGEKVTREIAETRRYPSLFVQTADEEGWIMITNSLRLIILDASNPYLQLTVA